MGMPARSKPASRAVTAAVHPAKVKAAWSPVRGPAESPYVTNAPLPAAIASSVGIFGRKARRHDHDTRSAGPDVPTSQAPMPLSSAHDSARFIPAAGLRLIARARPPQRAKVIATY